MSDYDAMFFLACLSFMGSSFIVLIWVFFPEVRNDSTTLICCLSGADLLAALMWASSSWSTSEGSDLFCEIQGALIQFADVAIIFWVTCIACHIHAVVLDSPIFLAEPGNKKFGILHLACWSVALVPVIAIASNDCFGTANQRTDGESPSKEWCWIRTSDKCFDWYYLYVVYLCFWIAVLVLYVRVIRYIKQVLPEDDISPTLQSKSFAAQRHVALYVIVFLVCWTPELFHRLCELYDGTEVDYSVCQSDVVIELHGCTRASQGFLNALIYGLFNTTFQTLVHKKMEEAKNWWSQAHCCGHASTINDENLSQDFLQKDHQTALLQSFDEGAHGTPPKSFLGDLSQCYGRTSSRASEKDSGASNYRSN